MSDTCPRCGLWGCSPGCHDVEPDTCPECGGSNINACGHNAPTDIEGRRDPA